MDQTAAEYTESRTEAPLQEFPAVTGGEWIQIASVWFYQKDGELVKSSWIDDKGVYYYVDDSGYMLSDAFTPDGYYVGADGSYDPGAPQNQGGGASSAAGTPAGEAMAAIAEKLSTDEVAGATEFDWFMDYVNQSGYGMAQVITDPARASRITDVQEALNGGWKAFIFTEKGVYGSDVERYLNANIDVFGGRFNITLNWKYLMEPNGGGTIEETGSTTYRGTYDDLEGTATAQTSDSRIDFDGFFLSADGKAEYCGTRLSKGAKYCRGCGKAVRTESSGGRRPLAGVLAVCIFLCFLLTAFWKPGFLRSDKAGKPSQQTSWQKPGKGGTADAVPAADAVSTAQADAGEGSMIPTTDQIPLRYSRNQRDNAPVLSAEYRPGQGRIVLGDVSVDIPSWELEENDRIEVRELPELSRGEEGWSLRAYDFSLASGIHEFDSDLTLRIPREGRGNGLSGCVWYNEDSGMWEDIYSEVSEDGKYYTIYTDHFSLFGEKKYRFDGRSMDLVLDDGSRIDLDDGIFVECHLNGRNRMLDQVMINYECMWNLFQKKNLENVKDIDKSIRLLTAEPKEIAALTEGGYPPGVDTVGEIFGWTGNGDSALEIAADLVGNESPSPAVLGKSLAITDVLLTGYKVYAEAKSDRNTPYSTALVNTINNHKLDLAGTTFSVAGALAPASLNPVFAIIGLSMYTISQAYQYYYVDGIEEWNKKYYPEEGEVFRRFYESAGVRLYYKTDALKAQAEKDYHVALMEKPANMDSRKYTVFRDYINQRGGLRTDSYKGFAPAFSKLIELYADDPASLELVLDDFYHSVSRAIWMLPDDPESQKTPVVSFLNDYKGLGKDPFALTRSKQLKLSESYFMKLKVDTTQILENVAHKYQRKGCEELVRKMEKEFLPVLNRTLRFRVSDGALASGQKFGDSVYCVDWQSINSNWRYRSLPDTEGSVFDDGFTAPIRFDRVSGPVFLPLDYDGTVLSERCYYPYDPNFIPRAVKNSNIVFRCTYFHYLMMGAPKQMVFRNMKNGKEVKAAIMIPKIDPKEITDATDVYITVNRKKLEIPRISTTLLYKDMVADHEGQTLGQSPENRLTVSPSGEVTFTLAGLEDYRISHSTGASAEKNYMIYNRPAMTLSGRVVEVDPDGFAFTTDAGPVSRIDGSGGSSSAKAAEPEKLIIIRGFLTGSPGGFEDRYREYYDGKLYSDKRYKLSKVGIAPGGYSGKNGNKGYSTFVIWQSKETGEVSARIQFRGDILCTKKGEAPEKTDSLFVWLDNGKRSPYSLEVSW